MTFIRDPSASSRSDSLLVSTSTKMGRSIEYAKGAATGKMTVPGELRTITKEEVNITACAPVLN
jgi:hypothetical protein